MNPNGKNLMAISTSVKLSVCKRTTFIPTNFWRKYISSQFFDTEKLFNSISKPISTFETLKICENDKIMTCDIRARFLPESKLSFSSSNNEVCLALNGEKLNVRFSKTLKGNSVTVKMHRGLSLVSVIVDLDP
jgi:hypothetical protein